MDKKKRYAYEWYVKAQDKHYFNLSEKRNKETAALAVTSLAASKKSITMSWASIAIGVIALVLGILGFFRA